MGITLCMIAKDEAHCIKAAIDSVAGLVNEVIVVDTGSTDGTEKIAESCGALVMTDTWREDFAFHRNQSIALASEDWILVLDADERLHPTSHEILRQCMATTNVCFELTQRHYTNDHRLSDFVPVRGEFPEFEQGIAGYFESSCVRFFPRHPKLLYQNRIHELVEPSIRENPIFRIVPSGVRIHHFGHTPEFLARKKKHLLYGTLGEKKIIEDPHNWQAFFELGVEYNVHGDREKSYEAFTKATALIQNYVPLWINRGYVLCELARYDEAIQDLQRALALDPKSFEAFGNLAVVAMRRHEYKEAIALLARALSINPLFVNGLANLGRCFAHLGRITEAVLAFERAIELSGGGAALLTNELRDLLMLTNNQSEIAFLNPQKTTSE